MNTIHKIIHHKLFEPCLGFMMLEGLVILSILGLKQATTSMVGIVLAFLVGTYISVITAINVYKDE